MVCVQSIKIKTLKVIFVWIFKCVSFVYNIRLVSKFDNDSFKNVLGVSKQMSYLRAKC